MSNDVSSTNGTTEQHNKAFQPTQTSGTKMRMRIPISSIAPFIAGGLLIVGAVCLCVPMFVSPSGSYGSIVRMPMWDQDEAVAGALAVCFAVIAIMFFLSRVFRLLVPIGLTTLGLCAVFLLVLKLGDSTYPLGVGVPAYPSISQQVSAWGISQLLIGLIGAMLVVCVNIRMNTSLVRILRMILWISPLIPGVLACVELLVSVSSRVTMPLTPDGDMEFAQGCFNHIAIGWNQNPCQSASITILLPFVLFVTAMVVLARTLVADSNEAYYVPASKEMKPIRPSTQNVPVQAAPVPLYTMVVMPDGTQQMMQVVPSAEATDQVNSQPTSTDDASSSRKGGVIIIISGVAVFVVCCIVQAACGSSMFAQSYYSTGVVSDILINITWYPGWAISILLVCIGVVALLMSKKKS